MRQQKHAEERANARLHVGHEEVQRQQRPDAFGAGLREIL
jgi:hypothetical protein